MSNSFDTIDPTNGQKIATHTYLDDAELENRIQACHDAFRDWRLKSHEDRGKVLKAIGQGLRNRKDELAELMTREMGKLLSQSKQEIELCAGICDYTAEQGPKVLASEDRDIQNGKRGRVVHAPIGVIYGIQPWNFPCYQVVRYSIANLMAGNGVLLKHASNVAGSGQLLEEIYRDAGLPDGLFSALIISHDQSDRVIEHERVRGVTLTGSPNAGRDIAQKAGKVLKKTVLELGSNDAYLVLSDADVEKAAKICVTGRIYNNGETCVAAKRFIVADSVYEDFQRAFVEGMKNVTAGDPTQKGSDIGPMARKDLRDDLHKQVEESVDKGARVLCGGELPKGDGYYYPATVLGNVEPGQPAYDDELFGPVASLIRAKDDEDAMRIANDSKFGLGGGIISKNVERAVELAATEFDTGMVFINGFGLATPNMPFGGVKDSGYGREHGGFGMLEFTNTKAVLVMDE
ncbi:MULTISPECIES: NAD-dependent succinate-semialdehyde dehydrogenase [unclassified Sulfitobacter]|uniref:NAD-dependent succinate-semialdehyde dehydrogenase n=1 Tax=unclassified Sulfitobacter TaxID=196795 RepID=UPI0007C2F6DA|nr:MULTISPECIES: NAD-dependent succinate-semialdehyde dehydrogenase [unclassified Sulfitobacter]KZX93808.1 succinate-semialdehyde dehydrogenase [Sulfitobacter sp. HI0023]KZY23369.1 succinate-semialdehyde dehydrogenase [Sulfitobacter sp. HI0040]KZZ63021.1 succinate-semialdehyde dehydrogenase [Sulfitobacter sp. HI0129]